MLVFRHASVKFLKICLLSEEKVNLYFLFKICKRRLPTWEIHFFLRILFYNFWNFFPFIQYVVKYGRSVMLLRTVIMFQKTLFSTHLPEFLIYKISVLLSCVLTSKCLIFVDSLVALCTSTFYLVTWRWEKIETTRFYNPQNHNLIFHRCENLCSL